MVLFSTHLQVLQAVHHTECLPCLKYFRLRIKLCFAVPSDDAAKTTEAAHLLDVHTVDGDLCVQL